MKIITDKKFLNRKSISVDFNQGIKIGHLLLNTLSEYEDGLGLSAPQIGLLRRVFVIKTNNYEKIFINPAIILKEDPFLSKESCLSFPNSQCIIPRYKKIHIICSSDNFRDETKILKGRIATVFQHELDHLNGITILD